MKIPKTYILMLALLSVVAIGFVSCGGNASFETVTVTPDNMTVARGSQTSQKFTAKETLSDNSMTLDMSTLVSWTSSDPKFVIDAVGNVTWAAGVTGTTTIKAHDQTNDKTGSTTFTVADPLSIDVTPNPASVANGATLQFTATASFSGTTVTQVLTSLCTWESSVHAVATIDASGLATAAGAGNTIINATYPVTSKKSADVTLTVP